MSTGHMKKEDLKGFDAMTSRDIHLQESDRGTYGEAV